jgi:integrase/recombinase XerC
VSNHLSTSKNTSNQSRPYNSFNPLNVNSRSHVNGLMPSSIEAIRDIRYFIEGYVLHHKSQRHSPHTITFHTDRLNRLAWFLEQENYPTALEAITPNALRHFLIYISEQKVGRWGSDQKLANRPMSKATIHSYAKSMRAFFRWATIEAGLPQNPFSNVPMPTLPNQWKIQTFTDEEIATMFVAINTMGNQFLVQRNRAILAILLDSGIRAGELLSLQVDSINPHEPIFAVTGKGQKTRSVVVGHFARRELWSYLAHHRLSLDTDDTALFVTRSGTALTYDGLKLIFNKIKSITGISRVRVSAHIARHTFSTKAHRNGMKGAVLQEVLGHAKFDTTRRYYLDVSGEDLKAEHSLYGPLDHMSQPLKSQQSSLVNGPRIPDAAVLAREVAQSNYRAVARRYGVSDTAIRKRLKKAGLL